MDKVIYKFKSLDAVFNQALDECHQHNSVRLLITWDISAHASEWDMNVPEDETGSAIMDFMDEGGFLLYSDSLPTYHVMKTDTNSSGFKRQKKSRPIVWNGDKAPNVTFCTPKTQLVSLIGHINHQLADATMMFYSIE